MLSQQFVSSYKDRTPPWGPMGYVIYKRTYARKKDNGYTEEWWETCERVCNGLHELRPEIWGDQELEFLFDTMFNLRGSVSGRALWQLGTETVRKVGADSLQNCFGREIRIHTSEGIRPIGECVGTQTLQTEYGKWVEAEVKSFGTQKTRTLRLSRFGKQTKELRCTDEHRWFVYSKYGKQEKTTKELQPGDKLVFTSGQVNCQASLDGIRAGLVFGDGTKTKHGSRAYLSSKDVAELEHLFHGYQYTEKPDGAKEFYYLPSWTKNRPSLSFEKGYLKGWLMGYFAADGYARPNGTSAHLDSYCLADLEHAKSVCSVVGIPTGPIYSQTKVSNLTGKECICYSLPIIVSDPEFFLLKKHNSEMVFEKREGKQLAWKVEEVCDDYLEEEVFCAVVPDTHSFVLDDNILTGNCWHVVVNKLEAFTFTFNQLMLGGGVGFNVLPEHVYELPSVKYCPAVERVESHDCDFIVPDNREGWVELLKRVLEAFTVTGRDVHYDTSCIRAKGKPIKGFGGTASGPEDLVKGIGNIVAILKRRHGSKLRPVDCMDFMNIIGQIVVAGNVRRSSEIALGHYHDFEYLDAKNWAKHQIPNWRVMSNNSVVADAYEQLPECFWESGYTPIPGSVEVGGEPYGLVNLKNCREFGRLVDGRSVRHDPLVMGVNPCAEITLGDKEGCNLSEIFLPNIRSIDEFKDVAAILFMACKTISAAGFSDPETQAIVEKHHRIGVGLTGCMQAEHWLEHEHLDTVYNHLDLVDETVSKVLGVKTSIKRTTIKPSGTLSLLPGVTPGMHGSLGRYMLRTVRFSADHPLVAVCREHGYRVEPKLEMDGSHDHGTMVIYFPIEQPGRLAEDIDVIEELEIQRHLQTFWSDNAVSATHYFEPDDVPRIKEWLKENFESGVKSTSFLRREGHGFKQAPFQPISKEEYEEEIAKVRPIHNAEIRYDGEDLDSSLECSGGHCPVR